MYKVLLLSLAVFTLTVNGVSAQVIVRTGDTVSISEEQTIAGDFYGVASDMAISGEIEDDLVGLGGRLTINGPIGEDVFLLGGSLDIHGPIGDDLRIVGGEVIIAEPVGGDVFVMAGNVRVLSSASVGGDIFILGGEADISGPVGGNVLGRADSIRIDTEVKGGVDVKTGRLVLGEKANVAESVQYTSSEVLTRSQNAVVTGDVVRNDAIEESSDFSWRPIALPLLSLLFAALVWYLVARRLLEKTVERAVSLRPRVPLLGLAAIFLAPLCIMILIVSVLGTLAGLFSLFAYVTLGLLSIVSLPALVGQTTLQLFSKNKSKTLTPLTILLGVIMVGVIYIVPYFGPLIILGLLAVCLGSIVDILLKP